LLARSSNLSGSLSADFVFGTGLGAIWGSSALSSRSISSDAWISGSIEKSNANRSISFCPRALDIHQKSGKNPAKIRQKSSKNPAKIQQKSSKNPAKIWTRKG
jgi:hypothetical protein